MSITNTDNSILLEGVCLTSGPDINGETVDLAGIDLSGIREESEGLHGAVPLTIEFDPDRTVGWAQAGLAEDGKSVNVNAMLPIKTGLPFDLDRMYLAPAGIVLERDGQTVKRLKLTSIGLVAQHADPNVPPIGKGAR